MGQSVRRGGTPLAAFGAGERELRQAAALLCSDTLRFTKPLPEPVQDVLQRMTRRLARSESWTVEDEREYTRLLLKAGASLTAPFDPERHRALWGRSV